MRADLMKAREETALQESLKKRVQKYVISKKREAASVTRENEHLRNVIDSYRTP